MKVNPSNIHILLLADFLEINLKEGLDILTTTVFDHLLFSPAVITLLKIWIEVDELF